MNLNELHLHYTNALAELMAKHAALLVENADLTEQVIRLEQTLALIRAQQDYKKGTNYEQNQSL